MSTPKKIYCLTLDLLGQLHHQQLHGLWARSVNFDLLVPAAKSIDYDLNMRFLGIHMKVLYTFFCRVPPWGSLQRWRQANLQQVQQGDLLPRDRVLQVLTLKKFHTKNATSALHCTALQWIQEYFATYIFYSYFLENVEYLNVYIPCHQVFYSYFANI